MACLADPKSPARRFLFTLTVVRHGETTANAARICQGQNPSPEYHLTELGEAQAHELGKAFKHRTWWRASSSDLLRARQTAELVLSHSTTPLAGPSALRLDERIREKALGARETQPAHLDEATLRAEMIARGETPPKLERCEEVQARIRSFLRSLADEAAAELDGEAAADEAAAAPRQALMVAHGGLIKYLLRVCGMPGWTDIRNTSVSVVDVYDLVEDSAVLSFDIQNHNDTSHLRSGLQSESRF